MIIAQIIIILPIIISVSTELLQQMFDEYKEMFDTFEVDLIVELEQQFLMLEFHL